MKKVITIVIIFFSRLNIYAQDFSSKPFPTSENWKLKRNQ